MDHVIYRGAVNPPPPPTEADPRVRLTRDERRAHFLDMAAQIITEQGVESLTMEGIAARAGVSKALGYRYFTNRADLLIALMDREDADYDARTLAALEGTQTLDEKLRGILDVFLDTVAERGLSVGTLMQSKLLEGPVEERRRAREAQIVEFIAELIRSEYPMPRRTAITTAAVLLAGAQGLVGVWITQKWSRREVSEVFVQACTGAVERVAREAAKPAPKPAPKSARKPSAGAKRTTAARGRGRSR